MQIEEIAAICHEANRRLCINQGDHSQKKWNEAPQWQKESAIAGVTFHLKNPDASPSASHDEWWKQKNRDGWRHGPMKDEVAKTHPCMVPFEKLPLEQQAKDHLFRGVVHSLRPFVKEG